MIFEIILIYLIRCAVVFLLFYCCDEVILPSNEKIKKPSLSDITLEDFQIPSSKLNMYEDYTSNVVCPSYQYFTLHKKISEHQRGEYFFFLLPQAISLGYSASRLTVANIISDSFVICLIVSIIVSIASAFVICFVYKHSKLKLKQFDEKTYRCVMTGKSFDISEECDSNNNAIATRYKYLLSVEKTESFRYCIREVLSWITMVYYLLLILGSDT